MKPTAPNPTDEDGLYDARRDPFERRLAHIPEDKRMPIIAVADTAYVALGWMQSNGLEFTASDVLQMTAMILAAAKEEEAVTRSFLAPHAGRRARSE